MASLMPLSRERSPEYYGEVRIILLAVLIMLSGCASTPETKQTKQLPQAPLGAMLASNKHPLAKYVELSGIRMEEAGSGKLKVTIAVVNHSEADLGDVTFKIKLTTTAAKPEDPPITEFDGKVSKLGPLEMKDMSVTVPTKLRLYELPDWQFLRAQYEITSAPPGQ
jgi:hypothetical protein